ncbi:MAG: hypothetical protein LBD59_10715 [Prevotellaceae bacterium]|jgi:hypothetical protein|nr:hypothetical protein [Prevotellaceae bacterium]
MLSREQIINAFAILGKQLHSFCKDRNNAELEQAVSASCIDNYWFNRENIYFALLAIANQMLDEKKLNEWLSAYPYNTQIAKRIKLIAAGNIPLVCFHDFLSILVSGNIAIIKPSSKDKHLLKTLCRLLVASCPSIRERIVFDEFETEKPDAVIATGSNNTARYFRAAYKHLPLLIRKNRYSLAILDGKENSMELKALGEDIFLYYGLGCRNISNIFVPPDYDFNSFLNAISNHAQIMEHQGYSDCFRYQKANAELARQTYFTNGFLILKKQPLSYSSIAVVNYMEYHNIADIENFIAIEKDKIQCVAGHININRIIPFGQSQKPDLRDYPDGVDTLDFLTKV